MDHSTRDAKVAFAHLVRAEAHRRAGNFGKVAQHQNRAGWLASRAARGIVAFGTDSCAEQIARLLGAKDPAAPNRGIRSLGWTCYMSASLQCLFVTQFEIDKKHPELRVAYNELKAAWSGETDPDKDTVGRFHSALRAVFSIRRGGLAGAMEIKERGKGEDKKRRSAAIDLGEFMGALFECAEGCAEGECPFISLTVINGMEELAENLGDSIPTVMCANVAREAGDGSKISAPLSLNVKGTQYDLVAVAQFDFAKKHNVAYTKRGGKWGFYDDDNDVRMATEGELEQALRNSIAYVYQKRDAAFGKKKSENL